MLKKILAIALFPLKRINETAIFVGSNWSLMEGIPNYITEV